MRVIWSIQHNVGIFTELQVRLLLASVLSYKKYNPEDTTVLWTDTLTKRALEKANFCFWDEINIDLEGQTAGIGPVFWDFNKVTALSQEKEKVLYVDYDIVFSGPISKNLDAGENYVYWEEDMRAQKLISADTGYIQRDSVEPWLLEILPPYGCKAYNTAVLYLEPEIVKEYRKMYQKAAPVLIRDIKRFWVCTVAQAMFYNLMQDYKQPKFFGWEEKFLHNHVHYLGTDKSNIYSPSYLSMIDTMVELWPLDEKALRTFMTVQRARLVV